MKRISIVCPVFNEEASVAGFHARLQAALVPLRARYEFELIFTNNRSSDATVDVIQRLRAEDRSIQVLTLSRNFGYQASVLAGLSYADGDAAVIIDVDCEDPPELIPAFVEKWEQGHDVVYGLRQGRPEPKVVTMARKLFYRILKAVADSDIILDMAEFSLVASHVRDSIIANTSTFPFLRSEIGYAGFSLAGIPYARQTRIAGTTHYNFWRMFMFAAAGILSSSTFPMRCALYFWPIVAAINLVALVVDGASASPRAFHWLVAFDLMYLISLVTIYGLYIARIYKNGIGRPVFIVDWGRSAVNRTGLHRTNAARTPA